MRVLWIVNLLLPEAYRILTKTERKGSGGWLDAAANFLVETGDVTLSVATASPLVDKMISIKGEHIVYYVFPYEKNHSARPYERFMCQLRETVKPDVVHIHGTEYPYGLAYLNIAGPSHVVISMQGVMSQIAKHYSDGLTNWQIISNITLRDLWLKTIFGERREYLKRGKMEREMIKKAKYIIGRTSFDQSFILSTNPSCKYLSVNESLRDSFYDNKWNYDYCRPHSIFLSQSNYPVKGLHQFLKALPAIRDVYPDVTVRIAGEDITKHRSKAEIKKYSGYGSIIYHLISNLGIGDCVTFTGLLSESEMVNEYLNANVFICPSTCENSSNSIAEAQLLGVPCVASSRGGNPDMIQNKYSGTLYDFYDFGQLASAVIEVFKRKASYDTTASIELATKRHNKAINVARTLEIYNEVARDDV